MKKIAIAALALVLSDAAFACKFSNLITKERVDALNAIPSTILTSPNKQFFLTLVSSKWAMEKGRGVKKRDSYALAFQALPDGQLKQLWSYKHWDANKTRRRGGPKLFLSNDGMNLVEFNSSVKGRFDNTALITYKNGKVVRAYPPIYFGFKKPMPTLCGSTLWVKKTGGLNIETTRGTRWTVSPETLYVRQIK